jgi:hypothetical protein
VEFTSLLLSLHEGFIDHDLKLACYTDHQIFDRYHRYRLRRNFNRSESITLRELSALKPGDYVTHIDHGVGRFAGLETIEVTGKPQEAVRLVYKDNDILYVSIHSLHRIAKYTGKEGTVPSLHKLGSSAWSTLKQRTKKKVKDIARDLIALYARRKASEGFAYAPDTYLQNELEASFIYEDTPDQVKATRDREARHGKELSHGQAYLWRRRIRQDRNRNPRCLQSRNRKQTGGSPGSNHYPGAATLQHLPRPVKGFSLHGRLRESIQEHSPAKSHASKPRRR